MGSRISNKLTLLFVVFTASSALALAALLWLLNDYTNTHGRMPLALKGAFLLALIVLPVLLIAAVRSTTRTIARLYDDVARNVAHLREAQSIARLGSWERDVETGKLTWSDFTFQLYGLDPATFVPSREGFYERVHPEDRDLVREAMSRSLDAGGQYYNVDHRIVLPDGTVLHVRESAEVIRNRAGKPLRVVGTVQDITENVQHNRELRESRERYRRLLEAVPIPLLTIQGDAISYINASGCELLGAASPEAILGKSPFEFYHPDSHETVRERHRKLFEERRPIPHTEERTIGLDGEVHDLEVLAIPLEEDGEPCALTAWRDVTRRKQAEEKLRHDALHDPLTGLPNRTVFLDRVSRSLALYRRSSQIQFGVLIIDLDHFRLVNDSLGHLSGDRLLVFAADRFCRALRTCDSLARLGGDEFAVLLEDISGLGEAQQLARNILLELGTPFQLDGRELFLTASAGLALCSPNYADPGEVLRDADTALFRAKADGRARQVVFDSRMYEAAVARLNLANDLRRAIDAGEFELHFQPMVEIASQKVVGVEALIRWRHPVRGLLNPAHFIPIAEESGAITALDRWVLEEACRHTLAWNNGRANGRRVSVSVNFSPRHFPQSDCAAVVQKVLSRTGLRGDLLSIEITESALIENIESSIDTIRSLNELGVQVHLDDYGTGYSSLIHLSRLPVSHLKIDRAFVRSMGSSARDAGIVQSTVALAHSLGMKAIAEGVETIEQLDQLKVFGCEVAQGYYFHPPLERPRLEELLAA